MARQSPGATEDGALPSAALTSPGLPPIRKVGDAAKTEGRIMAADQASGDSAAAVPETPTRPRSALAGRPGAGETSIAEAGLVALALVLLALPFWTILSGRAPLDAFNAAAADTFYYLKMARSAVSLGFTGVDGETVSNGYMPLWQGVLVLADWLYGGAGRPPGEMVTLAFLLSLAFTAMGLVVLMRLICRLYGPQAALLALPLLCPGAAYWLFETPHGPGLDQGLGTHYGISAWAFANGMESGVGFALFAAAAGLFYRFAAKDRADARLAGWLGAVCFLMIMARLDDIFFAAAIFVGVAMRSAAARDPRPALVFALIPALGLLAYLAANTVFVGAALPTSGSAKLTLFSFPINPGFFTELGYSYLLAQRALPLVLALFTAGLCAVFLPRAGMARAPRMLIGCLAGYLAMKAGFLVSSVPLQEQGYWYFTGMIGAMNLMLVMALAPLLQRAGRAAVAIAAVIALGAAGHQGLATAGRIAAFPEAGYTTVFRLACARSAELRARLAAAVDRPVADLRIVDGSDGAFAHCVDLPAMHVTGLPASPTTRAERVRIGLFPMALARGHDVLVDSAVRFASYNYIPMMKGQNVEATLLFSEGPLRFWRLRAVGAQ